MSEPLASRGKVTDDDEIDLREIWRVLVKCKLMILSSMFAAAVIAAGVTLTMPNIYRAEVLLAPVTGDNTKGGGMAAALGGLGGFASMAGISLPSSGNTEENIAVLKSREFLWKFAQENRLMPILFEKEWDEEKNKWKETDTKKQPGQMDVFRLFGNIMGATLDKRTNLVTVSIEWANPELAAQWVNLIVEQLNQHLRSLAIARSENNLKFLEKELGNTQIEEMRKTLFDLIGQEKRSAMLSNAQREFAFRVIDPAIVPDKKIKPKRSLIVLLAGLFGGGIAGLYALLDALVLNRRELTQHQ